MAQLVKQDLATAFNNDSELQQFVLPGVTATGKKLGSGSFGSVEEVKYDNRSCAGKKLRESLVIGDTEEDGGVEALVKRYLKESKLMHSLEHPNITKFIGLCFLTDTQNLPLIVMEQLEMSLDEHLHNPSVPLLNKYSILVDVASGLLYLHTRTPQVIHRDLTSKNVLLSFSPSLVAKITDMGNARIVNMQPGQVVKTLTHQLGTKDYMPPEALDRKHRYGPSLDIFSFGHLALYVLIQKFPGDLLPATFPDPDNLEAVKGRTEVERRKEYIDLLTSNSAHQLGIVQLVKKCLHNTPERRYTSTEILNKLQEIKRVEDHSPHDIANDDTVKEKPKPTQDHEFGARLPRKEQQSREVEILRQQLKECQEEKSQEILSRDAEIKTLRKDLKDCQTPALQLGWKRGADMPFAMGNYVQSVAVNGMVYVGGGDSGVVMGSDSKKKIDSKNDYIIMEYDTVLGKWVKLIHYQACYFTMTAIKSELVLVGGYNHGRRIADLAVLKAGTGEWTNPYPELKEARARCSALVSKEWLVVVGGWAKATYGHPLSSVEIMNTATKEWHTGPSTPKPCYGMTTAVVDDTCYFMGGYINDGVSVLLQNVYIVSLKNLLPGDNQVLSSNVWTEISSLHLKYPTPFSFGGSLLAVGGQNKTTDDDSALICRYKPDTGEWIKVGELPTPRRKCSCALLEDGRILVAGGNLKLNTLLKRVDIHGLTQ